MNHDRCAPGTEGCTTGSWPTTHGNGKGSNPDEKYPQAAEDFEAWFVFDLGRPVVITKVIVHDNSEAYGYVFTGCTNKTALYSNITDPGGGWCSVWQDKTPLSIGSGGAAAGGVDEEGFEKLNYFNTPESITLYNEADGWDDPVWAANFKSTFRGVDTSNTTSPRNLAGCATVPGCGYSDIPRHTFFPVDPKVEEMVLALKSAKVERVSSIPEYDPNGNDLPTPMGFRPSQKSTDELNSGFPLGPDFLGETVFQQADYSTQGDAWVSPTATSYEDGIVCNMNNLLCPETATPCPCISPLIINKQPTDASRGTLRHPLYGYAHALHPDLAHLGYVSEFISDELVWTETDLQIATFDVTVACAEFYHKLNTTQEKAVTPCTQPGEPYSISASCVPYVCVPPADDPSYVVTETNLEAPPALFNVIATCASGYALTPRTLKDHPEWEAQMLAAMSIECDGSIVSMEESYSCRDPTFTLPIYGPAVTHCREDGEPYVVSQGCLPINCSQPAADSSVVLSGDSFGPTFAVTVECAAGYHNNGTAPNATACLTDGAPYTVSKSCLPIACVAPTSSDATVVVNETSLRLSTFAVTAACAAGYHDNGTPLSVTACTANGDEYTVPKTCTAMVCEGPTDASVVLNETSVEIATFAVTVSCAAGYHDDGAAPNATVCSSDGAEYTVSKNCSSIVCVAPTPSDASVVLNETSLEAPTFAVAVSCAAGYHDDGTAPTAQACSSDGTGGLLKK